MAKANLLNTRTINYLELIGNGKSYRVPPYQRDYSWLEEEWEDLWNDIVELQPDPDAVHYMGALVVEARSDREFLIIDGQQRLATLSLLALAVIARLRDMAAAGTDPQANAARAQGLRDRFIGEKDPASLTETSRLYLNAADDAFYQDYLVQLREPLNPRDLPDSNRLLWQCFGYFTERLDGMEALKNDGQALAGLLSETVARQLAFILITVDDELNAYTVLETLNANASGRGRRPSPAGNRTMMNRDEFMRQIRMGEDSTLGLRSVLLAGPTVTAPGRNDFADDLAALANGRGGTVVLGVEAKSRDVIGIPMNQLDAVETWVREICKDSVAPPLDPLIRKVELPRSGGSVVAVICIEVDRSLFIHRSPGGYFRKLGSSKRQLAPELLARLIQQRSQSGVIRFDESVVPRSAPDDLDDERTVRFLREDSLEAAVQTNATRKLGLVADDDDGVARLTLAGVLMCTREPQRWLPHAYVQAVSFAGERTDVNYQTDARDIGGTLDEQVASALHFVRRNMLVRATKAMGRTDRPQFSERAVFEALVNAVAHRDYSVAGTRVRLHMFGDRLELHVPGALAGTLTPDTLHLRQASRNQFIVSLLARCSAPAGLGRENLMDRRGDGVPIILRESLERSGRHPEYTLIDEGELRLVIWAAE